MRLADVFQSFPSIILVLCLVVLVGPSVLNLVLVLGLLGWTGVARLVYGNTLTVRDQEYIVAARALGASRGLLLRRNVLPNVISPVWCAIPLRAGRAILSESSLSFLGVGIRAPQASWGGLIQAAADLTVLTGRPWAWLPPGRASSSLFSAWPAWPTVSGTPWIPRPIVFAPGSPERSGSPCQR